ncbi:site-2 protease family protein [Saccharopolyspora endophytica]|uniref:Zinc metalloprotease n=1 Tax=Saccharopolyspora endophytica TaxID=543886 RepID=A0ABS5DLD1_9PSEU|nr:site-2 protease family protein [Saccharopolyspora endophytica]MBQ0927102.1 site-2 protease family protein [Saccharopolyspora endophytica]
MNATIPLGRIAGVRVGLHWSVAGIVALVAVGLASVQLPAAFPGHSPVGYTLAGLAAATLLLGSLLTHELAHALVARRNAVDVDGITLWLLGGVAQLRGEARTPGADLRIAGIGPMTSGALALVFGLLGWLVHLADAHVLVVAVLGYLALLNVVLAVFNLLPAAPLDGGRVLRAVLWWWRGDRYQAALWSARAGLGLGGLLVLGGVVQLFRQSTEGLWTILLGLFLLAMAGAETHQARIASALAGTLVGEVMSRPVETASGHSTVEGVLRGSAPPRHHQMPILGPSGAAEGVISLRRLRAVPDAERSTTTLREIAEPMERVPTARPDEPLSALLARLSATTDGHVLVLSGRALVGIIAPSDINRAAAERGLPAALPGVAPGPETTEPPPNWWYPGQQGPR